MRNKQFMTDVRLKDDGFVLRNRNTECRVGLWDFECTLTELEMETENDVKKK